jgi:hypothetical protein
MLLDIFEIHKTENQITEYSYKEVDFLRIGKRVNWLVSVI